ncbi:MAG TPA: polymer-forming cytoskeletal protein [Acidobacteriota bacterium]|nr:polymer-forming cytoskeletal protein [Acidobacteriota bacterium]
MKERGFDSGEISGFLDEGTEFEGTLKFRETMRIDGKFSGKISSSSVLIVGEAAEINGEVHVSNVSINGKVTGKITADKKIEIHSKGRVYCDIATSNLVIEDGAFFEGNCNMDTSAGKGAAPAAAAKPVEPARPAVPIGEPKSFEKSPSTEVEKKGFEKDSPLLKEKK